jgi:hypothetical protein
MGWDGMGNPHFLFHLCSSWTQSIPIRAVVTLGDGYCRIGGLSSRKHLNGASEMSNLNAAAIAATANSGKPSPFHLFIVDPIHSDSCRCDVRGWVLQNWRPFLPEAFERRFGNVKFECCCHCCQCQFRHTNLTSKRH